MRQAPRGQTVGICFPCKRTSRARLGSVSGQTVYAGGAFSRIGGKARNHIAALDAGTGKVTAWNPNANQAVDSLAVTGKTVYAGGYFDKIRGKPRHNLAALGRNTGAASDWNPQPNDAVKALAFGPDGSLGSEANSTASPGPRRRGSRGSGRSAPAAATTPPTAPPPGSPRRSQCWSPPPIEPTGWSTRAGSRARFTAARGRTRRRAARPTTS
jgi:hypothetical protein